MDFHHIFDLTVAKDVMLGDYIVIPRGTPATGYISYRTGRAAFGKSAKIEIEMQWIHLNRELIPISGHYRQEGRGNTGWTIGAVAFYWPAALFIKGRSAIIPQDTLFKAFTKDSIAVTFDPPRPTPALASAAIPASATAITGAPTPAAAVVQGK